MDLFTFSVLHREMGPGRPRVTDSAKKRTVRAANKRSHLSRIALGKSAERWNTIRDRIGFSTSEFVRHLLDIHESLCRCDKHQKDIEAQQDRTPPASSSPAFTTPDCAQVDTPHFNTSFSSLAVSLPSTPPSLSKITSPNLQHFSDQEEIGGETEREPETETETDAETDAEQETATEREAFYDPNLSDARATFGEDSGDRSALEEDLLQLPPPAEDDDDQDSIPDQSDSLEDLVTAPKFIAYLGPLMELAKKAAGGTCSRRGCEEPLTFSHHRFGTAVRIKWVCSAGHISGSWTSQPRVKMFAGNLQLASSILFSGNSYRKVALLFKVLSLGCIQESTFYQVQKHYAAPAVDHFWLEMQTRLLLEKSRQGQAVSLAGDGRNDSPGHSAQYCTYSFLDMDTHAVLHLEVVDVREATSSVAMEKLGFVNGLDFLQSKVDVAEIVTDQSPSISKVLRTVPAYQGIVHQYDMWHAAKNLEKRLMKACRPNSVLRQWITPVKNHFWWSAQVCEGHTLKMKETWIRVLSHVCNIHEWAVVGHTEGRCSHGPLNQDDHERPWLDKKSADMDILRQVVAEHRFLKQFDYFRNFRHTGALEAFNNHILMYAPKRHAYHFIGYRTRNKLAAIDHNHHLHRPEKVDSNGDTVYSGSYSKRSQRWRPQMEKMEKNYSYMADLQLLTFQKKMTEGEGGLKRKAPVDPDDPKRISSTIAKRPCPPIKELVQEKISRFAKK